MKEICRIWKIKECVHAIFCLLSNSILDLQSDMSDIMPFIPNFGVNKYIICKNYLYDWSQLYYFSPYINRKRLHYCLNNGMLKDVITVKLCCSMKNNWIENWLRNNNFNPMFSTGSALNVFSFCTERTATLYCDVKCFDCDRQNLRTLSISFFAASSSPVLYLNM